MCFCGLATTIPTPSALGTDAGGFQPLGVVPTVRLGSSGAPQTLCCPHSHYDQPNSGKLLSLEKKRLKLHRDEVQRLLTKSGGTRARLIEVLIV